jgi:hypothetical protein
VRHHLGEAWEPSAERQALLGAHFTHEYSPESAALFNPSIVPHPDQSGRQPVSGRRSARDAPQHAEPQNLRVPAPPHHRLLTAFFAPHYNWQLRGPSASTQSEAQRFSRENLGAASS